MEYNAAVKLDECHLKLIKGVALALKPINLLELGIGSGATTRALLEAIDFNQLGHLTSVDNWHDWGGERPLDLPEHTHLTVVECSEKEFITSCTNFYDLIVSDADHYNSHLWCDKTLSLLRPGGVAFFHDVANPDFPNLQAVLNYVKQEGYFYKLFTRSSLAVERCERGLLLVT